MLSVDPNSLVSCQNADTLYGTRFSKSPSILIQTPVSLYMEQWHVLRIHPICNYPAKCSHSMRQLVILFTITQQPKNVFNRRRNLFTRNSIEKRLRKNLLKVESAEVWQWNMGNPESWEEKDHSLCNVVLLEDVQNSLGGESDEQTTQVLMRNELAKPYLWSRILMKRDAWIQHVLSHELLLKIILQGVLKGRNERGSRRLRYIDEAMKDTGCQYYTTLKRRAHCRDQWWAVCATANQL